MPTPPADTRRALAATRALFLALGLIAGVWGAHVPTVKVQYGLSDAGLGGALLAVGVGSVGALLLAGRLIGRLGTRATAMATGGAMALGMATVLHWPNLGLLLLSNALFGMALSVFDVAINAEGTALEARAGRPVMANLHGMFSLGAMGGALLAAGMIRLQWLPAWQFIVASLLMAAALAWAAGGMLDAHPATPAGSGPAQFAWPRGALLLIGLLIFAGMTAEGVMVDWVVLFLKQERGLPQDQAALGYAAFVGAMAAARLWGDRLRGRWADAALLGRGAWLAAAAMALALLGGPPALALLAFAATGAGLALAVPLLYTAASRVPGSSSSAALAAASSIGYAGFLVGPPLIGFISQALSLTAALWVVALAAVLLALGARQVGAAQAEGGRSPSR